MVAKVIRIGAKRDEDITEVLRYYLALAERGELRGLQLCAEDANGKESMAVVGGYRSRPSVGASSAMRLSVKLSMLAGTDAGSTSLSSRL